MHEGSSLWPLLLLLYSANCSHSADRMYECTCLAKSVVPIVYTEWTHVYLRKYRFSGRCSTGNTKGQGLQVQSDSCLLINDKRSAQFFRSAASKGSTHIHKAVSALVMALTYVSVAVLYCLSLSTMLRFFRKLWLGFLTYAKIISRLLTALKMWPYHHYFKIVLVLESAEINVSRRGIKGATVHSS